MVDSAEGAERAVAFPAAEVGPGVGVVGEVVVGGGGGGHFCGFVGFFFWFVFVSCCVLFGVSRSFAIILLLLLFHCRGILVPICSITKAGSSSRYMPSSCRVGSLVSPSNGTANIHQSGKV